MPKLRILSVDDDPDILDLISATLEDDYEVIQASSGSETLKKASEHSPDLLILDYNLPDMQGPQICQALRKNPLFLHIPILMLTGKGEVEDKVTGLDAGVDDYMLKPFSPKELTARIRMLMRRSRTNLDANPLTRLPGNVSINKELEDKIKSKEKFAMLYVDLDKFKALNDYYGFERGDEIIKKTARILIDAIQKIGTVNDFIGHIGGDDFVIVTNPQMAEKIAKKIIADFDNISSGFFDEKDRVKGYIETKDRDGQIQKFSFPTISVGIIDNLEQEFTHTAQISSLGTEIKSLAKRFPESKYIFNRRKT